MTIKKFLLAPPWHPGFLFRFLLFFGFLYWFHLLYIGLCAPGGFYVPFLAEHLDYIAGFRKLLLDTCSWIIEALGYATRQTDITVGIKGGYGIQLVYSCLGFGVMSFFAAFVILFPKQARKKWLFLILGLLLIQVLNIGRFLFLILYGSKDIRMLGLDHHDLFNLLIYIFILIMLYFYTRSYPNHAKRSQPL